MATAYLAMALASRTSSIAELFFSNPRERPRKLMKPVSCTVHRRAASIAKFSHGRPAIFDLGNTTSNWPLWHRSTPAVLASEGRNWRAPCSGEGVPREILEDSKFVQITEEDPRFGPPALLLLGFNHEEAVRFQKLLKDMEGDFLQVLLCTEDMVQGTLGNAVNVSQPNLSEIQIAHGLPRITFISGLTGEETMMLIQIYPEAGLEATVFAAHVPKNSEKSLKDLVTEIMDDHQRLTQPGC